MNLIIDGSDCEQSHVELIQRILQHPKLNYPKKGYRLREILITLLNHFVKDPVGSLSEKDIALMVYDGPVEEDDSQVRRGVTRLRGFLAKYFEENPTEEVRVEIPYRDYRLHFWSRDPDWELQPIDWFWFHYLAAEESSLLVIRQQPFIEGDDVRRKERHLQLEPEHFLRACKMFTEVTQKSPELIYRPSSLLPSEWSPMLAVGVTSESRSPLITLLEYFHAELNDVLLPFEDPNGKTLFSDPRPRADATSVYADDDQNAYALITRMNLLRNGATIPVTVIIAARGAMIERTMEVLSSDAALGPILRDEAAGGMLLKKHPSTGFQILIRSSIHYQVDSYDYMDFVDVFVRDPELVLVREIRPVTCKYY